MHYASQPVFPIDILAAVERGQKEASRVEPKVVHRATGVNFVRKAIDHGVTFMDNSWDYNEGTGRDELRMGLGLIPPAHNAEPDMNIAFLHKGR